MKKSIGVLILFINLLFVGIYAPVNKAEVQADEKNISMQELASNISTQRMMKVIEKIASAPHPVNSEEIQNVKSYLIEYFREIGYNDIECQKFEYNDQNNENAIRHSSQAEVFLESTSQNAKIDGFGENIIITKSSVDDTEKNLIISAHYDSSAESSGANDNGSGVSVVLELAEILKDVDLSCNIKFIMFSGEEKYMLGSRWFVGQLSESERNDIIGVINIDSIAEKSDLGYLAMISGNKRLDNTEYSEDDIKKLAELNKNRISDLFLSNSRFSLTMAMNSDHYPFSLLDIPAVSIVQDWQEGLAVNDAADVIENIDGERLEETAEQVLEVVFKLGSV